MSDIYNSKIAKFLGIMNDAQYGFAITVSASTTLYSVPKDHVSDEWRKHEDAHKHQIKLYGWLEFMTKYLVRLKNDGYQNNKFEVWARQAEEEGNK